MNTAPQVWRELRKALLHAVVAIFALFAVVRGAIGWADRGFGLPSRHVSAGDDGSFELLLIGAAFLLYGIVTATTAVLAARDAAHEDNVTENI